MTILFFQFPLSNLCQIIFNLGNMIYFAFCFFKPGFCFYSQTIQILLFKLKFERYQWLFCLVFSELTLNSFLCFVSFLCVILVALSFILLKHTEFIYGLYIFKENKNWWLPFIIRLLWMNLYVINMSWFTYLCQAVKNFSVFLMTQHGDFF